MHLWRLLSGEVPGGFALLITALAAFLAVWEFVYRAGETLSRANYRKWRLFGPLIIVAIYAIIWVQSPPKLEPLRIAVLPGSTPTQASWQSQAVADLAARSLRNTLNGAIVNPWEGATDYPPPAKAVAERAEYHAFMVDDKPMALDQGWSNAMTAARKILATLGINKSPKEPFSHHLSTATLEYYYQGRAELTAGHPDSAKTLLESALAADSNFFPAKITLARCLELAGNRAGAQELLMEASREDNSSTEAMLALGEFFLRSYEWNGAESALKVVLAKDPHQVRALQGLTHLHPDRLKDLRLNTPLALADEAVRLDPDYDQARITWADLLAPKGYIARSCEILQQGLKINPEARDLLFKLGALEIQRGNPEAARGIYQELLKKNNHDVLAAFNLGVVEYHAKQYDQAVNTFSSAWANDGPADCLYYLGMIYKIKGDQQRARYYFNQRWEKRTGDDDEYGQRAARMVAEIDKGQISR